MENKKILLFMLIPLFVIFYIVLMDVTQTGIVQAANESTVNATVTAQNVSVGVGPTAIAYGIVSVGTAKTYPNTIVATNEGNVNEDITIKGTDDSPWQIDTTNVTQDHYIHEYCTTNCVSTYTKLNASTGENLVLDLGVGLTQNFGLRLTTPQTSSVYTERSVDVILMAAAS
jgi:hypothetical protein